MRTASAVEAAARTAAPGSSSRRKRAHCASGCGWEITASIASSASGSRAIRQLRMASTVSPRITVSGASQASASSVAVTPPSSEFSTGTSARSTAPRSTAITASWIDANGTSSASCAAVAWRAASSLNVPGGPR